MVSHNQSKTKKGQIKREIKDFMVHAIAAYHFKVSAVSGDDLFLRDREVPRLVQVHLTILSS